MTDARQNMSRVFVPVTGSVVFSWQTNRSGVRMESSQDRAKTLLCDHGSVVSFHIRVQLLGLHMSK